jgi:hypothetical protein
MHCQNCKIDIDNLMVIMEDNTIWCYTCGRLKADERCRSGQRIDSYMGNPQFTHLVNSMEELGNRKNLYRRTDT